jgi:class 3 adenylate cyclase
VTWIHIPLYPLYTARRAHRGATDALRVAHAWVPHCALQAAVLPVERIFSLLARLFGAFDRLVETLGVHKIDTIGDAYWAASGTVANGATREDAAKLLQLGLGMQAAAARVRALRGKPCERSAHV